MPARPAPSNPVMRELTRLQAEAERKAKRAKKEDPAEPDPVKKAAKKGQRK